MKLLILLAALSGCRTLELRNPSLEITTECNGKKINPETQECLSVSEKELRSYGVRK